jgi:hypothetical protein
LTTIFEWRVGSFGFHQLIVKSISISSATIRSPVNIDTPVEIRKVDRYAAMTTNWKLASSVAFLSILSSQLALAGSTCDNTVTTELKKIDPMSTFDNPQINRRPFNFGTSEGQSLIQASGGFNSKTASLNEIAARQLIDAGTPFNNVVEFEKKGGDAVQVYYNGDHAAAITIAVQGNKRFLELNSKCQVTSVLNFSYNGSPVRVSADTCKKTDSDSTKLCNEYSSEFAPAKPALLPTGMAGEPAKTSTGSAGY